MNENIQDKRTQLAELESLISNYRPQTESVAAYCEFMKRVYLSCSTEN